MGSRGACHRAALCADPLARPGMTRGDNSRREFARPVGSLKRHGQPALRARAADLCAFLAVRCPVRRAGERRFAGARPFRLSWSASIRLMTLASRITANAPPDMKRGKASGTLSNRREGPLQSPACRFYVREFGNFNGYRGFRFRAPRRLGAAAPVAWDLIVVLRDLSTYRKKRDL